MIFNLIFLNQSFFDFFKPPCSIELTFADAETRSIIELQRENGTNEKLFLFIGNEPVKGNIQIIVPDGKQLEHKGVKVELIGQIGKLDLFYFCPFFFFYFSFSFKRTFL